MSTPAAQRSEEIVRFTMAQRVEHLVTIFTFTGLCLTGLPQKFYSKGWAQWMVDHLGGIDQTRWIHRAIGLLFVSATVVHLANALNALLSRRSGFTMVLNKKDFQDCVLQLRYYLGITDEHPRYDRFDYKQKWEYWSLFLGNIIMGLSGLMLFFPTVFAKVLPGQIIPAAKVAHSNEGLMAFFVIAVWHIYNAHLQPDVFPFDGSIFTGRISRERMLHEHPLELARIEGRAPDTHDGHRGHDAERRVV